ncbi:N-acetylmuramoyl-L-alanine amidase [Cohaesibacter celericrescens]|uniref:Peptidoglycan recognition protein family domain-containing protein n=1 Tax=Cohaesibacter celericrescens TaxID=2067669 RepID=A0A2N5XTT1_9HYPH|nr:N-acetylmuramoyl-L-alanine amidase [Cohaesibacter celericrescens]PLW77899.1 hypothetical protein C0081_07170 [Cohaesibacter celericrescens]
MRKIYELIWHCTATPEGREVSVAEIDSWHKQRGWNGIGYHKVIHLDGSVSSGRPLWKMGAHVRGHNRGTIGYVYVGGLDSHKRPKDTRTEAQKRTMIRLSQEAVRDHGVRKISGHRDYAAKACPCFDASGEYRWITNGFPKNDPVKLTSSRTMKGSTTALVGGAGLSLNDGIDLFYEIQNGFDQIQIGSIIGTAVGLAIICGAAYALYARWDDAGRPTPTEIFT